MRVSLENTSDTQLETIISTPSHIGCVRAIGSSKRYSISGGNDELINVFDIAKCRQLGNMGGSVHTSSISAVAVSDEHGLLVSGCEDGQVAITRLKDFETLRSFKGHKSAVLGLSIHPSGRLALSISTDNTLRMWDLTRGTCAAVRSVCPLRRPNTCRGIVSAAIMDVKYTPLGSRYIMLLPGGKIEICSSTSMEVLEYQSAGATCVCALSEDTFLLGDTKGSLTVVQVGDEGVKVVANLESIHNLRVRAVARLDGGFAASVCAEGKICFSRFDKGTLEEIRSVETGLRITCFTSNS